MRAVKCDICEKLVDLQKVCTWHTKIDEWDCGFGFEGDMCSMECTIEWLRQKANELEHMKDEIDKKEQQKK